MCGNVTDRAYSFFRMGNRWIRNEPYDLLTDCGSHDSQPSHACIFDNFVKDEPAHYGRYSVGCGRPNIPVLVCETGFLPRARQGVGVWRDCNGIGPVGFLLVLWFDAGWMLHVVAVLSLSAAHCNRSRGSGISHPIQRAPVRPLPSLGVDTRSLLSAENPKDRGPNHACATGGEFSQSRLEPFESINITNRSFIGAGEKIVSRNICLSCLQSLLQD